MRRAIPRGDKGSTLTLHMALAIRKRGGRCTIVTPDGSAFRRSRYPVNDAVIKALARSFRWNKLLASGRYASIEELAEAERINPSYLGRTLRLSLLAPIIVEELLNVRNSNLPLARLRRPFPTDWSEQARWAAKLVPLMRYTVCEDETASDGLTAGPDPRSLY
jgi:hypothetical protein